MSLGHGTSIVRNGLVFYYDMNNTQKSWKGKPATNVANTGNIYTSWNNSGSATFTNNDIAISRLFSDVQVNSISQIVTGNSQIGVGYSLITAAIWTASAYIYIPSTSGTLAGSAPYFRAFPSNTFRASLTYYGNNDWNTWPKDRWIRIQGTWNNTANDTSMFISCYTNTAGNKVYLTAPQVELGDYATPFVVGTRSNTQAIIDLSNTNTIIANSILYNSDGTFSFDGASRISTTLVESSSVSFYTRVVWVKPTATSIEMKSAILNQIGNNSDMAVGIENGYPAFHQYTKTNSGADGDYTFRGSSITSLNSIYMIAVTVDRVSTSNNIKIYLNGKLDGTTSKDLTSTLSSSDSLIIGGPITDSHSGSRMFYGNIYSAMHYNRVLSDIEIKQNFEALRGRYGI